MLFRDACEYFFKVRVYYINIFTTLLTERMVVVWRKNLAEFYLAFKAMPDAINNTKAFE